MRPGRHRGLCPPAGDRAAPGASWPLTNRGYVASAAQDKRTAVPVGRACFCFRAGGRGATGTAGPGPRRYPLCQLGPGGPPRPDLGDRSAGVCGSTIAQLTTICFPFLVYNALPGGSWRSLQPLYFEAGPKPPRGTELKPPNKPAPEDPRKRMPCQCQSFQKHLM